LAAQEGILLGHDKCLTEGTVSNVFLVKKNEVMTPRLNEDLLPGVTRDWVCRWARDSGYVVHEKKLGVADLVAADEVFLTSTIMELMPVSRIVLNHDDRRRQFRLGPYSKTSGFVGPVTLDLMGRFKRSIDKIKYL